MPPPTGLRRADQAFRRSTGTRPPPAAPRNGRHRRRLSAARRAGWRRRSPRAGCQPLVAPGHGGAAKRSVGIPGEGVPVVDLAIEIRRTVEPHLGRRDRGMGAGGEPGLRRSADRRQRRGRTAALADRSIVEMSCAAPSPKSVRSMRRRQAPPRAPASTSRPARRRSRGRRSRPAAAHRRPARSRRSSVR